MIVTDPTTEASRTVQETPRESIRQIVGVAHRAQPRWAALALDERVMILSRFIQSVASEGAFVELIGSDMGKPRRLVAREIERTVEEHTYTLDHAREWLAPEPCPGGVVHFDPLGVVAVISPWNFPLLLPLRAIVPALLAGNGVVFKPSELSIATGCRLAELLHQSLGSYREVFQLIIGGKEHGRELVEQEVAMISFTGSTAVGKSIAQRCAERLTRVSLELGGLDPAIVLDDAHVESAAEAIVSANCSNSGQVCNAVKRVYVDEKIYDRFLSAARAISRQLKVGEPSTDPDLGPLSSEAQLTRVEEFVSDAVSRGAEILTGGERVKRPGYFFPHTVLVGVPADARMLHDEPFGPLLPIMKYATLDEAVALANGTRFGLTASVWSQTPARALEVAQRLVAGTVSINEHSAGQPGAPWGGAKESGLGRMKTREGLREFTNTKLLKGSGLLYR